MMYQYLTLADETEIVHSELHQDGSVIVHFERPKEGGFDTARCTLPSYSWIKKEGFTEQEIAFFEEFLRHNAHLIFKYARSGGLKYA